MRHDNLRYNVLICLTVFVVFVLVFEDRLSLPLWLQALARTHVMIVHLPIVLIPVAVVLVVSGRKIHRSEQGNSFLPFAKYLLFAGAVLAGVSVAIGLFLAKDGDYLESALLWHKWSGVLMYFFSVVVFVLTNHGEATARVAAVVTVLLVVVAGHFGGSLTHGENFVLAPIAREEKTEVTLEDAIVFEHVVRPIFDAKCKSCHNPLKRKGQLLLTDSASLMTGGKNGPVLVSGKPEESLLMHRLHLPLEDKKRMPPDDRPQLTDEEKMLLYRWVQSGAVFGARVSDLAESDSFRIVAVKKLQREINPYDFPPVGDQTLARLNSNYRVVRPISTNSPALSVNVYNRSNYSASTLRELKEVKEQVVSLDLSNMPVNNGDLDHIGQLHNLQRLNLNFTSVTGEGLHALTRLKKLESLSLAGTGIGYPQLQELITSLPELQTVSVWETSLTEVEIEKLKRAFPQVSVVGQEEKGIALIRLNPPTLGNKLRVFQDSLDVQLAHAVPGTIIRYALDDSVPDSVTSPVFDSNLSVDKTSVIKARAFKPGWLSSDVASLRLYRSKHKPDTAVLQSRLNRVHTADGAATFFDHQLGSFNANSPAWANNWGGVRENNLELMLGYKTPRTITSVSINSLIETENVIFPPERIEVWGGASADSLMLIGEATFQLPTEYRKPYIELFTCSTKGMGITVLRIIAVPVKKIPDWHKNKDRPALLLIDEILVN